MKRQIVSFACVCALFVTLLSIPAAAASQGSHLPYSDYSTTISPNYSIATATIRKCDCNPVDNYLGVMLRIQYRVGDNYYWKPGGGTYAINDGRDIHQVSCSLKQSDITYAQAVYKARCANAIITTVQDYATR